jgi:hypothetical protein
MFFTTYKCYQVTRLIRVLNDLFGWTTWWWTVIAINSNIP